MSDDNPYQPPKTILSAPARPCRVLYWGWVFLLFAAAGALQWSSYEWTSYRMNGWITPEWERERWAFRAAAIVIFLAGREVNYRKCWRNPGQPLPSLSSGPGGSFWLRHWGWAIAFFAIACLLHLLSWMWNPSQWGKWVRGIMESSHFFAGGIANLFSYCWNPNTKA